MLRPLLRLYLVVILFVGASIIFIQLSFDRIFYERGAQAQRDSLTTYSFVLNDYLERHPGAQRELALRELALHGREGFGFMSMADAREAVGKIEHLRAVAAVQRHGRAHRGIDQAAA